MCQGNGGLELEHGILHIPQQGGEKSENMIVLSGRDRRDLLIAAITPLRHDNPSSNNGFEGVMLVIIDPQRECETNDDLLKQVHTLTNAEVNITSLLARGMNYAEIAKQRNVTPAANIWSNTKSIFNKTSVRKVYAE